MDNTRSKLWFYFTTIVFSTILAVFLCITACWILLFKLQLVPLDPVLKHTPLLLLLMGSILIGGSVSLFVGRLIIRPVQSISNAFSELSKGNFAVRVSTDQKLEEIRDMAEKFNSMAHDLSCIETIQSDFVANVSHEFKTPIAAIEGYATLLQDPSMTHEKHDRYVEKILENSRRLSNLSSNILMLSKLENQEIVMNLKEYRLDEQLRKALLMLERKWTEKQIEPDVDLDKQMIVSNEQLLEQVWINLLDNAIKYSNPETVIRVLLKSDEDHIFVTIADQGCGMSEEVQKHVFEKFYQADSSRKQEGNGLGLALVKRILDLCEGTIELTSSPKGGSSFTVRLPLILKK